MLPLWGFSAPVHRNTGATCFTGERRLAPYLFTEALLALAPVLALIRKQDGGGLFRNPLLKSRFLSLVRKRQAIPRVTISGHSGELTQRRAEWQL